MSDEMIPLPITTILDRLKAVLKRSTGAVVQAPPGAGKTTGVPPALLNESWLRGRRMIMLEPRRLAARAAAFRMADLLGEPVGQTVGYRVRMDRRVGPSTRIEVVTEGVLTRLLQSDPALTGVGLVILDEYHERSVEADLALALCCDLQGVLNHDLRLLVMSATLDAQPVADLLGGAPVLTCRGRSFPVETHYCHQRPGEPLEAGITAAVLRVVAAGGGSVLAFLPGVAEIKRVARRLEAANPGPAWRLAPLYGNLSRERQQQAIAPAPAGEHKIVLASAIAETSLTIEGIRVVVDSGLSRVPRFDVGSGLTRLVTLPVTRASADQRRGRAGRTAPGTCYRMWSRGQHAGLVAHARPAILDADLTPLALELALWGVKEAAELKWLDPPPKAAFAQARVLLRALGALDDRERITDHGRAMVRLPLHPRLAHMVLMARTIDAGDLACDLAALLSERDILRFEAGARDADLRLRLDILGCHRRGETLPGMTGRLDRGACRRVLAVAANIRRRLGVSTSSQGQRKAGILLAWAYPERIAQQRPGQRGRYLLAGGRGAFLAATEPLAAADYLVAAALDGDRREARIFLGAALDVQDITDHFGDRLQWVEKVAWHAGRQALQAERGLKLGALCLKTEPLEVIANAAREAALLEGIRSAGLACLPWRQSSRNWQARVMFLRRLPGERDQWPDVSDQALAASLASWLGPQISGVVRLRELKPADLSAALKTHLSWAQQQRLDRMAPTHYRVPSGARRPIDYSGEKPVLAVRIQEMFGLCQTPTVARGRQTLLLHLLSPAGRPAQITEDLAGFWANSYPAVKKELKGRYPKHHWPDDPRQGQPRKGLRPR